MASGYDDGKTNDYSILRDVRPAGLSLSTRRMNMAESILNGKKILAVDDEPDVLTVLEEEILRSTRTVQWTLRQTIRQQRRY